MRTRIRIYRPLLPRHLADGLVQVEGAIRVGETVTLVQSDAESRSDANRFTQCRSGRNEGEGEGEEGRFAEHDSSGFSEKRRGVSG